MKIYIVVLNDYDYIYSEGYFTDRKCADVCCEYLNKSKHSVYEDCDWVVVEYEPNTTDFSLLLNTYNELLKSAEKQREKDIEKIERKELARLKAKYE